MPYTFRTSDLPKLDLDSDRGTDFSAWRQQWRAYRSLSGLSEEPASRQVQALLLCFSRETLAVVDNLGLTEEQQQNQAEIITALETYVKGRINESVERRNLRLRTQQQGECFDDFLISLRELSKTCNFCNDKCQQKALRDQLIEGLREGDDIQELLKVQDLSLDDAISKCRAMEAARKSRIKITESQLEVSMVTTPANKGPPCVGCGQPPHRGGRKQCPAQGKVCHKCGKVGHFGRVCQQRPRKTNPQANGLHTHLLNITSKPAPKIQLTVTSLNGKASLPVLPDSGADICAAGIDFLQALGESPDNLATSDTIPKTVSGHLIHPLGKLPNVKFEVEGRSAIQDVLIFQEVTGALISWSVAQKLDILPRHYPEPPPRQEAQQQVKSTVSTHEVTTQEIMAEFPTVFDGHIRVMPGELFHITLRDNARPFCVTTPRTIPLAYREKLKKELDLLVEQGIIESVTEPTEWCAPIVVTPKKNSDRIRMCVDLSKLNQFVRREWYPSTTPAAAVADIAQAKAKYFTTFDAIKGYHQIPLDEDSQKLTTFITPYGRFKFLRAPYGISSISEHYNRRMDEAFAEMKDFRKVVDDVIVFDSDQDQHTRHVRTFLQQCEAKGISLNPDKFQFCQQRVSFAGFTVTPEGYTISSHITDAISKFPTPSSRTDLRSFFGLANQMSSSTSHIAEALAPLRPLLSPRNDFLWTPDHNRAFDHAKEALSTAPTLAFFDTKKETCLYTDASGLGVGYLLLQNHGHNGDEDWRLAQAGSRFLTDTESRYAVIELECLAVAWAVKKCNTFLAGIDHFMVIVDHHPLIAILNTHRLDEIENPRLQRLRTRLLQYNFTAKWIKGSTNEAADALSRHPCQQPCPDDELAEADVALSTSQERCRQAPSITQIRMDALEETDHENLRIQELWEQAETDQEYQDLKKQIKQGFPNKKGSLPESLRKYWAVKDHLTIDDGLVVYGCRLLIPTSLRATMLSRLHEAHQGVVRSQSRAHLTMYWPGIDRDIENFVHGCKLCQDHLPSLPREPMVSKQPPTRPFQEVAADFASYGGREFLITVDCKTDWPDIIQMSKGTSARKLIDALRSQFCRTAVPDTLWSDGGPQFTSASLQQFLNTWGISHRVSSPRYPQSNGKIEATVKSMKKLIISACSDRTVNWDKLCRSLLQYRNTPCRKDKLSPAQKLFGHPIQDHLPAHRLSFSLEWQRSFEEAEETFAKTQQESKNYYNIHAHALPDLIVGNHVAIQHPISKHWEIHGVVTAIGSHRRYFIKTTSGRVLVRNRRFIRRRVPVSVAFPNETRDTPRQQNATASNGERDTTPATPRRSTRSRRRPQRLVEEIS